MTKTLNIYNLIPGELYLADSRATMFKRAADFDGLAGDPRLTKGLTPCLFLGRISFSSIDKTARAKWFVDFKRHRAVEKAGMNWLESELVLSKRPEPRYAYKFLCHDKICFCHYVQQDDTSYLLEV